LYGWESGFAGRNGDGPVMVKAAGSDTYSLAGLVGFGPVLAAEDEATKLARAKEAVKNFVETKLGWLSRQACRVNGNGDEVVYTEMQKLAIVETMARDITGGKGGKHITIELPCGDGKTGEWRRLAKRQAGGGGG